MKENFFFVLHPKQRKHQNIGVRNGPKKQREEKSKFLKLFHSVKKLLETFEVYINCVKRLYQFYVEWIIFYWCKKKDVK